jgi:hypothetical protein
MSPNTASIDQGRSFQQPCSAVCNPQCIVTWQKQSPEVSVYLIPAQSHPLSHTAHSKNKHKQTNKKIPRFETISSSLCMCVHELSMTQALETNWILGVYAKLEISDILSQSPSARHSISMCSKIKRLWTWVASQVRSPKKHWKPRALLGKQAFCLLSRHQRNVS